MASYILVAVLAVVPFASSMYINKFPVGNSIHFDTGYDAPDATIISSSPISGRSSMAGGMPVSGNILYDYDTPDAKFIRRNAFGQLQAFDVSTDRHIVRNAAGGLSQYNVYELSDPDYISNTVVGGNGYGGYGGGYGGYGRRRFGTSSYSHPSSTRNFVSSYPMMY